KGIAISPANLLISYKAHVVMPYHKQEDALREQAAEGGSICTTRRGIGPTYADKMHRNTAIRVADLLNEQRLEDKIGRIITDRNKVFQVLYDAPPIHWKEVFETYRDYGRRIAPFVDDTGQRLIEAWK